MKNNETLLRDLLNRVFGFPDARAATYSKLYEYYDNKKSQHVVLLEFRVARHGEKPATPSVNGNKQSERILYQLLNTRKHA